MAATIGPDGFVCMTGDPLAREHAALNAFLAVRGAGSRPVDEAAFTDLKKSCTKAELVAVVLAIYARLDALEAHRGELREASHIADALARLARYLYAAKPPFGADDLVVMLAAHRRHAVLWFVAPPEIVADYVGDNDLTPALAAAIRSYQDAFQAALRQRQYTGQAAQQAAQQHLHLLRWLDAWDEIDLDRCWSEIIRRDLRAMTGAEAARWRGLLRHIKGNMPTKPAARWSKAGERLLRTVGIDDFRSRLSGWLQPLRPGAELPLSVAGSHVLRGLLWYAALTQDAATIAVALSVVDATWKPKRTAEKVAVGLMPLLESMPAAAAWPALERLQRQWPMPGGQIERLLKKTAAALGIDEAELMERGLLQPASEAPSVAAAMTAHRNGPVARLEGRAPARERD
jgi:hypothetical protein